MRRFQIVLSLSFLTSGIWLFPAPARGQIFVTNATSTTTEDGSIAEYSTAGDPLNVPLVSGGAFPAYALEWIAVSGSDVFVINGNTVDEYSTSGTGLKVPLISGLNSPTGITVSGSNLFFINGNNTIEEYTTSGTSVHNFAVSGMSLPEGIAVAQSGSAYNVFVANSGNNTVGEYTLSGTALESSTPALISTGLSGPQDVAVAGSMLYVTDFNNGAVGQFTTSGGTGSIALVSDLVNPFGIAVSGSNLLVTTFGGLGGNTIDQFNATTGDPVNSPLVSSGLDDPAGIAVDMPEPSGPALLAIISWTLLPLRRPRRQRWVFAA